MVADHPLAVVDDHMPDAPAKRWHAECTGPHGTRFDEWFATDTAAMIAVEEHIAYAVGQHLEGMES